MDQHVQPREIVQSFARCMERRLEQHDGDGPGWRSPSWNREQTRGELYTRLKDHVEQLTVAVLADPERVAEVAEVTADIGNYAMMIADLCGALTPEPLDDQGRQLPVGTVIADGS